MLAVTLAAGMGTRMKTLTAMPKTLIEFRGQSLLSRQKELFEKFGIEHFVVGGYKHELLNVDPEKLIVNERFHETNMAYSLWCARDILLEQDQKTDLIISYGDIIFEENVLKKLINVTQGDIQICADKNFLAYWSSRMSDPENDLESFSVNKNNGYIIDIGKKAKAIKEIEAQYIGLFKISSTYIRDFLDCYEMLLQIDDVNEKLSMTDLLRKMIEADCKALPVYIENGWLEFDTDSDFKKYNHMLENKTLDRFYHA